LAILEELGHSISLCLLCLSGNYIDFATNLKPVAIHFFENKGVQVYTGRGLLLVKTNDMMRLITYIKCFVHV